MDLRKFEALEERITALLNKTGLLAQQNEVLEDRLLEAKSGLAETQLKLEAAEKQLSEMLSEREAITMKVDALLERLE
jgi:chromosome segregation ATPase